MFKRRVGNCTGNAIVEFALVLPLLLSFLGGVIDFGLIFFVSHTVQNAAREGARHAVTLEDLVDGTLPPEVATVIESRMPATGLFESINTESNFFMNLTDCQVRIRIAGTVPFFFLRSLFPEAEQDITRSVTMRYERCPDESPSTPLVGG